MIYAVEMSGNILWKNCSFVSYHCSSDADCGRPLLYLRTIVERTGTGWLKKIQIHMIDGASESDGSKCHYGNQYVELDGE
jgi:hypothetical protein